MAKFGLLEATANIRQTIKFSGNGKFEKFNLFQRLTLPFINKLFVKQIKTDYSFYRGLKLIKTERIESQFFRSLSYYFNFQNIKMIKLLTLISYKISQIKIYQYIFFCYSFVSNHTLNGLLFWYF